MAVNGSITLPTLRAIKRLGANGKLFQSQDVRGDLSYSEKSDEAHRMHAVIHRLKTNKTIAAVDDSRQRNQYLRVIDEDKLRQQIERAAARKASVTQNGQGAVPASDTAPEVPHTSAPKRVKYLEDRVADLEEQLEKLGGLPSEVGRVRSELEETNAKLDKLIALWS